MAAEQVKSQFTSATSASAGTADTYTNTRIQISPFFERALDAQTRLRARLERTQLQSSGNSSSLSRRPDTATNLATAGGSHRAARLTYELDARYLDTEADGPLTTVSTQRSVRGTVLYALSTELDAGVILGRESSQYAEQRIRDTIKGIKLDWHPSERTTLRAAIEDRFFGNSWTADFAQRSNTHTLGVSSSSQISNYITTTGVGSASGGTTQALLDAMLTTRIPNEAERAKAVNDLIAQRNLPQQLAVGRDLYDLNTLVRQNLVLRGAIMNARTMLLLSAGQTRSRPLAGNAFSSLLGSGSDTHDRYIDAQVNHRLSPLSTVTAGLRFGRARAVNSLLNTSTSSRDTGFRMSLSTSVSPRTQAVAGVRRVRTVGGALVGTLGGTVTENAVFAGLEHQF